MYNGVGGIAAIKDNGQHFYYADYRVDGGVKDVCPRRLHLLLRHVLPGGRPIFRNLIYYKDDRAFT